MPRNSRIDILCCAGVLGCHILDDTHFAGLQLIAGVCRRLPFLRRLL